MRSNEWGDSNVSTSTSTVLLIGSNRIKYRRIKCFRVRVRSWWVTTPLGVRGRDPIRSQGSWPHLESGVVTPFGVRGRDPVWSRRSWPHGGRDLERVGNRRWRWLQWNGIPKKCWPEIYLIKSIRSRSTLRIANVLAKKKKN